MTILTGVGRVSLKRTRPKPRKLVIGYKRSKKKFLRRKGRSRNCKKGSCQMSNSRLTSVSLSESRKWTCFTSALRILSTHMLWSTTVMTVILMEPGSVITASVVRQSEKVKTWNWKTTSAVPPLRLSLWTFAVSVMWVLSTRCILSWCMALLSRSGIKRRLTSHFCQIFLAIGSHVCSQIWPIVTIYMKSR